MNKKEINKIINRIEESKSILITTHVNADADAIGSVLAMFNFLEKNFSEKYREVIIDGYCPEYLKFLKNSNLIKNIKDFKYDREFDLAIVLDCCSLERVGHLKSVINMPVINIDHHLGISEFDYVLKSVKVSSTTQLIYTLLKSFKKEIDKDIANCLYVGLVQDTGNFIWNIYQETFLVAYHLIALGAECEKISSHLFSNNSYEKLKLIAYVLSNMIYIEEKDLVYSIIPKEQLKLLKDEDIEGVVDILKSLDKADIAVLVKEYDNIKRVSIRSKGEYADIIAKIFNGGGHKKAAGFVTDKSSEELIEMIKMFRS